jgi:hypothetical protein
MHTTLTISDQIIAIVEQHQTAEWLAATGIRIRHETGFRELLFDPVDEYLVGRRVEALLNVPMPSSRPWPATVGELVAIVERLLQREDRLALVRDFFVRTWRPAPDLHALSGKPLLERLLRGRPQRILDVGCGDNLFRPHLPDLIGIDVANPRADVVTDLLRYEPVAQRFDVILALGSINFGREADIVDELRHAASLLTDGGRMIMRVNPGIRWRECAELEMYRWSRERAHAHGRAVGLAVDGEIGEEQGQNGPRLVFTYRKRDDEARRGLALHYRPSSARVRWNAWRQNAPAAWRRVRRAALRFGRGSGATDAQIDFATDKFIWIVFAPGMSGHALARIISASPDVFWDRDRQGIEPLQLRSPHDWHGGQDAITCHYLPPFSTPSARRADNELAFTWGADGARTIRRALDGASEQDRRRTAAALAQPLKVVHATHVPDAEVAAVFPNCRRVALVDRDPDAFWTRTFHEKLNMRLSPHALQNRLWRGEALDAAIAASPEPVPLHQGAPVTFLRLRLGLAEPTPEEIRRYYRQLTDIQLQQCMAEHTSRPDTIVVDRARLFSGSEWKREYEELCRQLAIEPVADQVGQFIRDYNDGQWRRRRPAADRTQGGRDQWPGRP